MAALCHDGGPQMLFKDFDSVLVLAAQEAHVLLAAFALDHMVADAGIRVEMRHWRALVPPYLAVPYRTVPYLTLPYLTVPYLTLPFASKCGTGAPWCPPLSPLSSFLFFIFFILYIHAGAQFHPNPKS